MVTDKFLHHGCNKIYREKSAEAIVPDWLQTVWEGLNFRRSQ